MENFLTKEFKVILNCDPTSGKVLTEYWENEQGNAYRLDGPSLIERCPKTNHIIELVWTNSDGKLHREDDKPAHILIDPLTSVITLENYYINGKQHRQVNPSFIRRDATSGKVTEEQWRQDDEFYRETGLPIIVEFDPRLEIAIVANYGEGRTYTICEVERDPLTGAFVKGEPNAPYNQEIRPYSQPRYFNQKQCSLYEQALQLAI
jgi:hypothetical protein